MKTLIRSFSRRIGKSLSNEQKELLNSKLNDHLFSKTDIFMIKKLEPDKKIFLEIGFGMGEHFIHQISKDQTSLFIGAEVYMNGVANVLKMSKEKNITNFLLWHDDIDIILEDFEDNSLNGVYILFPDPWPKRKQNKKRILNNERLNILYSKLLTEAFIFFASDIDDYFAQVRGLIMNNPKFKFIDHDFHIPYPGYIETKYHKKAIKEGREAKFLKIMKI